MALGLLAVTGCTTIDPASAQAFSTGVTAARAQTRTAFDTMSALSREAAIDYAITQNHLSEEALVSVPSRAAVDAWSDALAPFEQYAQHLAIVVSSTAAKDVEDSMAKLVQQFNATSDNLEKKAGIDGTGQISPGLATALTEVASYLSRLHAQNDAVRTAAVADPQIRRAFIAFADAIGESPRSAGLRGTAWAAWAQFIGKVKLQYLETGDRDRRRALAQEFISLLGKRDAQDETLASLRQTFLSLADAHSALAKGNAADLRGAVSLIAEELKHARELQARFKNP